MLKGGDPMQTYTTDKLELQIDADHKRCRVNRLPRNEPKVFGEWLDLPVSDSELQFPAASGNTSDLAIVVNALEKFEGQTGIRELLTKP